MPLSRLAVGDRAPDAAVRDSQGAEVRLGRFWDGGLALLVFLRHYG